MFAGLHIRANEKYPSTVVLINQDLKATDTYTFKTDTELYALINDLSPTILGIGSPTSLPLGLCCLEPNCNCQYAITGNKGRVSEIQMASMSISCFYTTRGSISKNLIYRSINIYNSLSSSGHKVIETYPHATKSILFKTKESSSSKFTNSQSPTDYPYPFLGSGHSSSWDKNTLNAALSAYTAGLYHSELTDSVGDEHEGLIIIPSLR
tara:strand:+ start:14906 stop:15532 length:627 start_codon:yes stop_codon:yes gene_type:complete